MEIKEIIKKYWHWPVIIFIAVCFFIGTSSYNYLLNRDGVIKWSSPDETANYTFAKLYSQEKKLSIFEKENLKIEDIARPRSFRSDYGEMKPVSFLGIILIYGKIASLTSYKIIPYLTPLFASAGIIFFYLIIRRIFGRTNALISALLLASFPVYIYFSAKSMFHNVLFISLLMMGIYFGMIMLVKREGKRVWLDIVFAGLSGFFFGLAIITRASELLWVIPLLFIIWLFNIKKIGIKKLIIFISFLFLGILPALYWNQILYGSPYFGGYGEMNRSIINIGQASAEIAKTAVAGQISRQGETIKFLKENLLPFGYNPKNSLKMFYFYFVKMFPIIFWLGVFGFIVFMQKMEKWKARHYAYAFSYFILSYFLIVYYGSWKFNDNPDPTHFTIGNSYTRYWLPIYLGVLPLAAMFIKKATGIFYPRAKIGVENNLREKIIYYFKKILVYGLRILIIAVIFFISLKFVIKGSEEGLLFTYQKQKGAKEELAEVLNKTEENATIITYYHDKVFFPERKVIVGLFDDNNMIKNYAIIAKDSPVYYYNFTLPNKDLIYLNEKRLRQYKLQLLPVVAVKNDFTLYKLNYVK